MPSREEIIANARKLEKAGASSQKIREYVKSATSEMNSSKQEPLTPFSKAWNALEWPEKKSREGLKMLAGMVPEAEPVGNPYRDLALNTPRIAAETLAEVVPDFVSRESMLTSGALKGIGKAAPAIKAVGRGVGSQLEKLSGLSYENPGVLAEAKKDPTLFFGKGKDVAGKAYEAIQNTAQISPDLKTLTSNRKIIDKALTLHNSGSLTPDEALIARQAVDQLPENLPTAVKKNLRDTFDFIAKEKFAEADAAYSRAVKSQALRKILPVNKSGTPSLIKLGVQSLYTTAAPFLSPAAQGIGATGIGVARKIASPFIKNPGLGVYAQNAVKRLRTPYNDEE